jgi:hypothetical protein
MKTFSILAVSVIVAACNTGTKTAGTSIDEAKTKEVFDHHLKAFQQNDLDGVMSDYTEESILITPEKTYTNLADLREGFAGAFKASPTQGTTMTVIKSVVTKDLAYMVWKATTPTMEFKYCTDTFIIQNGKIIQQTFAGDIVPLTAPAVTPAK